MGSGWAFTCYLQCSTVWNSTWPDLTPPIANPVRWLFISANPNPGPTLMLKTNRAKPSLQGLVWAFSLEGNQVDSSFAGSAYLKRYHLIVDCWREEITIACKVGNFLMMLTSLPEVGPSPIATSSPFSFPKLCMVENRLDWVGLDWIHSIIEGPRFKSREYDQYCRPN